MWGETSRMFDDRDMYCVPCIPGVIPSFLVRSPLPSQVICASSPIFFNRIIFRLDVPIQLWNPFMCLLHLTGIYLKLPLLEGHSPF